MRRGVLQLCTEAPARSGTGEGCHVRKNRKLQVIISFLLPRENGRLHKSYIISTCDGKREHSQAKTGTRAEGTLVRDSRLLRPWIAMQTDADPIYVEEEINKSPSQKKIESERLCPKSLFAQVKPLETGARTRQAGAGSIPPLCPRPQLPADLRQRRD